MHWWCVRAVWPLAVTRCCGVNQGQHDATMLIYQYDVAGVSYEASQDVTYLRQWINLHSCRLGLPTSVKYDSRNPGNSMVISEGWIGLRQ